MEKHGLPSMMFLGKAVYDADDVLVGHVSDVVCEPRTRATSSLVVELVPETREVVGAREARLELPASCVSGVRHDRVLLRRARRDLARVYIRWKLAHRPSDSTSS